MVSNSFLQSDYCKRVTPYDPIRGWICFSQTTQCFFVLQCNSAISCLAFVNDLVKTVGRLQMIEGRTYFLTWTTFSLIWMKNNRKYCVEFNSFFEPQNLLCSRPFNYILRHLVVHICSKPPGLLESQWCRYSIFSWVNHAKRFTILLSCTIPHIPQNLFNWTSLRLLWFWLFLVIVPACHIVQFWSLLNFVNCCFWKVDTCGLYRTYDGIRRRSDV